MDLHQIHRKDVFLPPLGQASRSRSKVKVTGTKNALCTSITPAATNALTANDVMQWPMYHTWNEWPTLHTKGLGDEWSRLRTVKGVKSI